VFAVAVWIARDATNHGHEGSLGVMLFLAPHFTTAVLPAASSVVGFFVLLFSVAFLLVFSWAGLPLYLFARRRGELVHCGTCSNRHLHYARRGTHCDYPGVGAGV
jgi:hypothetical protein